MKIDGQAGMLMTQAMQNQVKKAGGDKEKRVQTARDFEAIFVQQVFKSMRQTIPQGGLLPRGQAEEIFSDMQDMEAAKLVAGQNGIGLAEMLLEQMQKSDK